MRKNRFPFELRFFISILIIVGIVATIGVLTFRSMKNIVNTVQDEGVPDQRQLLVIDILSDLSHAESSVRTYLITSNTDYLTPFYRSAGSIDEKMDALFSLKADTILQHDFVDSMDVLVENKFRILNDLLALQNDDRVKSALNKISVKLQQVQKQAPPIKGDTTSVVVKEKSNIFSHIFGKKDPVGPAHTELPVVKKSTLPVDEVKQEITRVSKEETKLRSEIKERELALTKEDKVVMDRIRAVIAQMEGLEMVSAQKRTKRIEQLANTTDAIIARFCFVASILLLVIAFVLIRYARKNRAYSIALKEAKAEAEAHALAKERFLANMSHEIRTPMNAIAGFTEQVLKGDLSREHKEQLMIVKNSADHLLRLLNNILDFSKLEAGKIQPEKVVFDPLKIIEEAKLLFLPQVKAKGLQFTYEIHDKIPKMLVGDPMCFMQILLNLTSNAVKFTEKGSIGFVLSVINKDEKNILLTLKVKDTGIGIAKNDLAKIFDEFEQADRSITRKFGGTGLGLTITKKLVELQGGSIRIDANQPEGVVVTIDLPFKMTDQQSPENFVPEIMDMELLRNKFVLIADDEKFNRQLLRTIFKKWNVSFLEAASGIEVLDLIQKNDFDLILMDVRMPLMDGLQATRKIRERSADLPVIAFTAAAAGSDIEEYKASGMNAFLLKPFKEAELFKIMVETLNLSGKKNILLDSVKEQALENKNEVRPLAKKRYDLEELKRLSNGDSTFFKEMIGLFVRSTKESLAKLRSALNANDMEAIASQTHKMIAPCKHIAAETLSELIRKMETGAKRSEQKSSLMPILENMEKEMALLEPLLMQESL